MLSYCQCEGEQAVGGPSGTRLCDQMLLLMPHILSGAGVVRSHFHHHGLLGLTSWRCISLERQWLAKLGLQSQDVGEGWEIIFLWPGVKAASELYPWMVLPLEKLQWLQLKY